MSGVLDGPFLFSFLQGSGGLDGQALLVIREKDASVIADLLIGQEGTNAPERVTELHLSAFGEVVQQLAGVLTSGLKPLAGPQAHFEVQETVSQEGDGAQNALSQLGSSLAVLTYGLNVEGLVSGDLMVCFPGAVATRLSTGSGRKAGPSPAQVVKPGASVRSAQSMPGGKAVEPLENEFAGSSRPAGGNIALLMDVPLKLTVELGRTTKLVKEILALAPGSVVELDKLAGEAVDILVNEKLIAKGEVVVIDENFGVRITEIINPEERLTAVQG
ncbi:MAG TPA: flagellar motor switch protein FliN [bacterium]|nr:flagellar motor switch protein FliN [bacterium]